MPVKESGGWGWYVCVCVVAWVQCNYLIIVACATTYVGKWQCQYSTSSGCNTEERWSQPHAQAWEHPSIHYQLRWYYTSKPATMHDAVVPHTCITQHLPVLSPEHSGSCPRTWHTPWGMAPCWWKHRRALSAGCKTRARDWVPVCVQCCQTRLTLHQGAEGSEPEWASGTAAGEERPQEEEGKRWVKLNTYACKQEGCRGGGSHLHTGAWTTGRMS